LSQALTQCTVEPLSKGHFGNLACVPCREVIPISVNYYALRSPIAVLCTVYMHIAVAVLLL